MRIGKLLAAAAAVSALAVAPALANPAAPLSVASNVKAKTASKKSNKLAPEVGVAIGLVVVGGTVAIIASDDDDSD